MDARRAVLALAAALLAIDVPWAFFAPGPPSITRDSAFFQHAGWYVATQGAVPYVDVWMLNPPAAVVTTTVFALLGGGTTLIAHVLAVAATVGAVLASIYLAGGIVQRLTGDAWAGAVAAAVLLSVPGVHDLPAYGFQPKLLTIAFGLWAVALTLDGRSLLAGAAGAVAAAYWQFGVALAAAAAAVDRDQFARYVAGAGVVTAATLSLLVAWGNLVPALLEVVLAPLATDEPLGIGGRTTKFVRLLGPGAPVILGGIATAFVVSVRERASWMGVAAVGALLHVGVIDFDWIGDLFLIGAVGAIGVGVAVARIRGLRERPRLVAGGVFILLVWSVIAGPEVGNTYGARYWGEQIPEYCHYQLGGTERRWLEVTGRSFTDACGEVPDDLLGLLLGQE